eukprot:Skav208174  [mRNA]  locus=scaffold2530:9407:11179:+ [translate_table: standard]
MWFPALVFLELVHIVAANDLAFVAFNGHSELSTGRRMGSMTNVVPEASTSSAALFLGASAVLLVLGRSRPREPEKWPGVGDDAAGSSWRSHQMLRKQAKLTMGRKIRRDMASLCPGEVSLSHLVSLGCELLGL